MWYYLTHAHMAQDLAKGSLHYPGPYTIDNLDHTLPTKTHLAAPTRKKWEGTNKAQTANPFMPQTLKLYPFLPVPSALVLQTFYFYSFSLSHCVIILSLILSYLVTGHRSH
jgi:hypothetical protein